MKWITHVELALVDAHVIENQPLPDDHGSKEKTAS